VCISATCVVVVLDIKHGDDSPSAGCQAFARSMTASTEQVILAIDPGTLGAFALLGERVIVDDLPVHEAQHGRAGKVRTELDLHTFDHTLSDHHIAHAFIEKVNAMPGQGVTSMFRFGYAAGAVYGLVVAHGIPVTFVTPQQWQRYHQIGSSPDAARQRAVQLYPDLTPLFARKRDQHRADALLIGCYGQRIMTS
jgi:crossover junction endodeoxyribonuclease RuvC